MKLRMIEWTFLAMFGGCGIVASIESLADAPTLQVGAFGLVGFVVSMSHRQSKEQRGDIRRNQDRMAQLIADDTDAKNRLAEALGDRPCLAGDSRTKNAG